VSNNLSNFLVDVASDPARMDAFLADPLRLLNESTLSEDEKAAVMTRDGGRIRSALGVTPGMSALPNGVTAKRPPASKGKPKPPPGRPGKNK
jgi:hypothetical protein